MATTRRREFDVARGLAVVFMIAVHLAIAVYAGYESGFGKVIDFLGSAPAAPVFMFLLGANVLTSRHNDFRTLFRRGLMLLIGSYIFNVVCHALPFYVIGVRHPTDGWMNDVWAWVGAVDILTFAGLAFILIAVLRKLRATPGTILGVAVLMHAIGAWLNAKDSVAFEGGAISACALSVLYNASTPGYFSVLTWFVYPAAGMCFANSLFKVRDEGRFWTLTGVSAGLVWLALLAVFCLCPSVHGTYYGDDYVYYRNGYFMLPFNLSFVVAWLAALHGLCYRLPKLGTGVLLTWSCNLTPIYVVQWFAINFIFVVPFANQLQLNTAVYLLGVAGVIFISDLAARIYRKVRLPICRDAQGCLQGTKK